LQSKGVDSVAARVTNIRDVNPDATFDQVNEALIDQFLEAYGGPPDIEVPAANCAFDFISFMRFFEEVLIPFLNNRCKI
jgi:lipoate-protein ligase A